MNVPFSIAFLGLAVVSPIKQHRSMLRHPCLIAGLALLSSPASAEPELLKPTGKWVIDYDASQCMATRAYGSEAKPLYLVIKPSPTSNVVQLALVRNGFQQTAIQTEATIRMEGQPAAKVTLLEYGVQKKLVKLVNLSQEQAAALGTNGALRLDYRGARIRLDTGPLARVMKELADCRVDLREYWNATEQRQSVLRQHVTLAVPVNRLFSSGDYPAQAIRERDSGTTSVVVLVDEKGAVADCMIDETSGIATLDAMTCIVIRERAKFQPAIGADGKPVRGAFTQRVRWEMWY